MNKRSEGTYSLQFNFVLLSPQTDSRSVYARREAVYEIISFPYV